MTDGSITLNRSTVGALACSCAIFGAGAFTGKWGLIAASSTAVALSTLAIKHRYQGLSNLPSEDEEDCDNTHWPSGRTILTGVLASNVVISLIPLWQVLTGRSSWLDPAYLEQLVLPTLTLSAALWTQAKYPVQDNGEKHCWMPFVEQSAICFSAALATTGIGYFSISPTPILGLLTLSSFSWVLWEYRKEQKQKPSLIAEATPLMIGIAGATALKMIGLLGARYAAGILFKTKELGAVTAGQTAALVLALAAIAAVVHTRAVNEGTT